MGYKVSQAMLDFCESTIYQDPATGEEVTDVAPPEDDDDEEGEGDDEEGEGDEDEGRG